MNHQNNYFTSLSKAIITLFGETVHLERGFPVQGGDINKSYGMTLSNGEVLFMYADPPLLEKYWAGRIDFCDNSEDQHRQSQYHNCKKG